MPLRGAEVIATTRGGAGGGARGDGSLTDPHVFVAYITDHRGLADIDDRKAFQDAVRLALATGGGNTQIWASIRNGNWPFVVFTNTVDGQRWGKFYDERTGILTIKPAPASTVLSTIKSIGHAIVASAAYLVELAAKLCAKFQGYTDSKAKLAAAEALSKAAGLPPGTIATARKVCDKIRSLNILIQGAPPLPADDSGTGGRTSLTIGERLAASTGAAIPASAAHYPSGTVVLRVGTTYMILSVS